MDWLEIYLHEPGLIPLDANYFRNNGYKVKEREYGTRMYRSMFTIYEHNNPVYEIRRDPLSKKSQGGIFVDESCHIRVVNQELYMPDCIRNLKYFLKVHGYRFQNISRFDIALDIQKFDTGLLPENFVATYMRGDYRKINQPNLTAHGTEKEYNDINIDGHEIAAHGTDSWSKRVWNSLKWGSPTSAISTKLYNKSLELSRDGHDKPYIRDAWYESGLQMESSGHPTLPVWRIEFSVRAQKRYLIIDDQEGKKVKTNIVIGETMTVDLDRIADRWSLLYLFMSYQSTYFQFKKLEYTRNGTPQRKDRCPDVVLFKNTQEFSVYKPVTITHKKAPDRTLRLLLKKLREIAAESRQSGEDHELLEACVTLMRYLQYKYSVSSADSEALDELYRKLSMEPAPEMKMILLSQYLEEKFPRKPKRQRR